MEGLDQSFQAVWSKKSEWVPKIHEKDEKNQRT